MRVGFWVRCLLIMLLAQPALGATLLVVGDSISAGFGLDTQAGWVDLLHERGWSMHPSVVIPVQAGSRACRRCLQSIGPSW